jgi:hypothetical protein
VGHRFLLSLPAVAAAIVAWAVLTGAERARYVQILGGPTREGATLTLLLRAIELDDDRHVPIPALALRLEARAGSTRASATGTTDVTGQLEARLDFGAVPAESPWLRVEPAEPGARGVLAEGELALDVERWRAGARRDGGWLKGQNRGDLLVRVAAESGAFAVPFAGNLVVQVLAPRRAAGATGAPEDDSVPLAGALVQVELDGAERVTTAAPTTTPLPTTDAAGQTRVALRPLEHAVNARITARVAEQRGEWYGVLPVVPGAIVASLMDDAIVVRSPIAREQAFVSIVSARERIAGAIVPLAVDPDGSASGRFELSPALRARLDAEPTWAVASSEYDKRSPGVVGWPLTPAFDVTAPRLTLDVPDQVLLDGRNAALYSVWQRQRDRRRTAAAGLIGVGALMSAALWTEVRRGRRRGAAGDPRRAGHDPDSADEKPALTPDGWVLGVALGCIALGLGALAYFGMLAP